MQFDTWWKTPSVYWSGVLLAAQADAGDSRRDQGAGALDLQWDAGWGHWSKHDTAYIQADYVLQCGIQLNLWTRHTWWIYCGVQGFVKVVMNVGQKLVQIRKISFGKWIKRMRKWVWRLKIHPTLIYSCRSFGRLYKFVPGFWLRERKQA